MGTTALVTGSRDEVAAFSRVATELGIDVLTAHDVRQLSALCTLLGSEAVDCYIQLPMTIEAKAGDRSVVDRAAEFLAEGLLTRFALALNAVPVLRPKARVALVAGHEADEDVPDCAGARLDLLSVLARAVAADAARPGMLVNVIPPGTAPEDIAEIAIRGRTTVATAVYAGLAPDGSFDDWRREALSHVSHH